MDVSLENAEFPESAGISRLPKVQGGFRRISQVKGQSQTTADLWSALVRAYFFFGAAKKAVPFFILRRK